MFGLRNKTPEPVSDVPAGPLDRIGRRADARPDGAAAGAPLDRQARLAEAAASLAAIVAPRLRALVTAGTPARAGTPPARAHPHARVRVPRGLLPPPHVRASVS